MKGRISPGARRASIPIVLCLLLGCAGEEGGERPVQGSGPAAESASDDWPCEKQGYPCTWEEVDDEVAERSRVLGEAALDRFEPGDSEAVVDWLRAQPDVAEAELEEPTVIRFRVENGSWVYIEHHGAESGTRPGAGGVSRGPQPEVLWAGVGPLAAAGWLVEAVAGATVTAVSSSGVTGRDRNADRRVNQRDQRKALVLEPMLWEWCYVDLVDSGWVNVGTGSRLRERRRLAERVCDGEESRDALRSLDARRGVSNPDGAGYTWESRGARVKAALEKVEAYQGNVRYLAGEGVDLAAFEGWEDYDVIHYASHGSRSSLTLGSYVNWGKGRKPRGPLARRRGVSPWLAKTWNREGAPQRWVWAGDQRFFRALYPRGLDRVLFFASTCKTLGDPGGPTPALVNQLLGRQSMFVGWGGSPTVDYAGIAVDFYNLVGLGWSGEEALKRLPVFGGGDYEDPIFSETFTPGDQIQISQSEYALAMGVPVEEIQSAGGIEAWQRDQALEQGAVLGSRGSDMRIREVTRLLHPPTPLVGEAPGLDQAPVEDGDDLDRLIEGELGDKKPDRLRVTVEVEAIRPDQAGKTRIHLELDGKRIGKPKTVAEGGLTRPPGSVESVPIHRVDFEDVPVGKDLKPDEEYELEAIVQLPEGGESRYAAKLKGEDCPVVIQGDFEGQLGGGHAQTFERGRDTQVKFFLREGGRSPSFHVEQRSGGRDGWGFFLNVELNQPLVAGARIRVEENRFPPPPEAVEAAVRAGDAWPRVSGSYRPGRRADTWGFPKGAANIVIRRVRWLDVPDRAVRRGMACGELEASLDGLVPRVYPYQFVPHTFKAKFWAEIRREATLPGSLPEFIDPGARP